MEIANSVIGADGKIESLTLIERRPNHPPDRGHVLARNRHTGEFGYEIYDLPVGADPVLIYANLTAHRSAR
jgi:hypothetical protein